MGRTWRRKPPLGSARRLPDSALLATGFANQGGPRFYPLTIRFPNPIRRYFTMSATAFALNLFFTDVYFNWRELTTSRKT